MAQMMIYKCKKCGFRIQAEPWGHYGIMEGMYYTFKCRNCKSIVSIPPGGLVEMGKRLKCPKCNDTDCLSTWNATEGHCPKCNSQMMKVPGTIQKTRCLDG